MEEYLTKKQQDEMKSRLYGYLKDKAMRRGAVTSSPAYEGVQDLIGKQAAYHNLGTFVGGLSEAASMAGTLGGKRAESSIIPDARDSIYRSTQGALNNLKTMRDLEEASNMNDLRVAQYLSGLEQHNDRMGIEKKRLDLLGQRLGVRQDGRGKPHLYDKLEGLGGEPVVYDDEKGLTPLQDFRYRQMPEQQGQLSPVSGVDAPPGQMVVMDKQGNFQMRRLPPGAKQHRKMDDYEKQQLKDNQKVMDTEQNIQRIDDAIDTLLDYDKKTWFGTGPIATFGGFKRPFDQKLESVDSKFRMLNIKNMVQEFDGKSRAVDSDAERRAWEKTQAHITTDEKTNYEILLASKGLLLKEQQIARDKQRFLAGGGNLVDFRHPVLEGKTIPLVAPNGEMKLYPKDQFQNLKKQGFMTTNEYAKRLKLKKHEGQQKKPKGSGKREIRRTKSGRKALFENERFVEYVD